MMNGNILYCFFFIYDEVYFLSIYILTDMIYVQII